MVLLAVISLSVGAVLAQRFKIMVLGPATVIMFIAALSAGFVQAPAWWIVSTAAVGIVSVQVGYLLGLGIRHFFVAPVSEAPRAFRSNASARHPVS